MKYKPRNSNFDLLQNEIADEIFAATNTLENIKDKLAKIIDDFVDNIIAEHLAERHFSLHCFNSDGQIEVEFNLTPPGGFGGVDSDQFSKTTNLNELLLTDLIGNSDPDELEGAAKALEQIAAQLRVAAAE